MEVMYLGEVVRRRRKQLDLPQEAVCEGLCTPMTLSRFEGGRQTPSLDCVTAILQRLGLPDGRYYAQLTRGETQLVRLRKEALACYKRFEQTSGEEQRQARAEALEKLHKLERYIKEDDRINQQVILGMKVILEAYPPKKQLAMLMEAIRLTSPRFDLDDLSKCLYSANEVVIISRIALSCADCGQRRKAIDIYSQLLKLILKRTSDQNYFPHYLPLIAYNYALYLALEKRFEEALEIAELGRQICIKREHYCLFPKFLHIEAECYYFMGEISRSAELYQSAFHIYGATMDTRNQEFLKADVRERFNLTF